MKIHLADSKFWKLVGDDFQKKYIAEIEKAYEEAYKLLPFGSSYVNFFVQPSPYRFIPETGEYGFTVNSELIHIGFDPGLGLGAKAILKNTRSTVFHELNHAARWHKPIWHKSFLDSCIMEGLATVFERDFAKSQPLWGKYPKEVLEWLEEIKEQGKFIDRDQYMFKHKDGRRWIGYKVGTYIIDQAVKNSGKSVIELTQMECEDVLKLAQLETGDKG